MSSACNISFSRSDATLHYTGTLVFSGRVIVWTLCCLSTIIVAMPGGNGGDDDDDGGGYTHTTQSEVPLSAQQQQKPARTTVTPQHSHTQVCAYITTRVQCTKGTLSCVLCLRFSCTFQTFVLISIEHNYAQYNVIIN